MGLEEEFGISVEEESAQSIATVQDAADLIEKLIEKKWGKGRIEVTFNLHWKWFLLLSFLACCMWIIQQFSNEIRSCVC